MRNSEADRTQIPPAARWQSRLAVICVVAAVAVLLLAEVRVLAVVLTTVAGFAITLAALWGFASNRGWLRWTCAAIAAAAPVAILVLLAVRHVWWAVSVAVVLVVLGMLSARAGARRDAAARPVAPIAPERPARPPQHPVLIMNPRSGGGKVGRFDLVARAEALGADVIELSGPEYQDVAELARHAIADGADLIGVAGGDGTQALVAAVAAEHGLPFLVLSAGTRNHFAMDLGLDREDPAAGLQALQDGTELCIDLGDINGRTFVNNASFGAYAEIVQSPAYRDDKRGTTLDQLPDLLNGHRGPRLVARIDGRVTIEAPTALLVSNNPYQMNDLAGLGRRYRLDTGRLGVVSVSVHTAAQAARLIAGARSKGLAEYAASEVVVDADADEIAVGIDGEAVLLPTPVRCRIRPHCLRVQVPRNRPGGTPPTPSIRPAAVVRLAINRS